MNVRIIMCRTYDSSQTPFYRERHAGRIIGTCKLFRRLITVVACLIAVANTGCELATSVPKDTESLTPYTTTDDTVSFFCHGGDTIKHILQKHLPEDESLRYVFIQYGLQMYLSHPDARTAYGEFEDTAIIVAPCQSDTVSVNIWNSVTDTLIKYRVFKINIDDSEKRPSFAPLVAGNTWTYCFTNHDNRDSLIRTLTLLSIDSDSALFQITDSVYYVDNSYVFSNNVSTSFYTCYFRNRINSTNILTFFFNTGFGCQSQLESISCNGDTYIS